MSDNLGTTRDVVDNSSTLAAHYVYNSFGQLTSGPTNVTQYLYTGQMWDADVGLQYNWNRWYDPAVGRWISEDPMSFAAGDSNISRYVSNDPGDSIDTSGEIPIPLPPPWWPPGVPWPPALAPKPPVNNLQNIQIAYIMGMAQKINNWEGTQQTLTQQLAALALKKEIEMASMTKAELEAAEMMNVLLALSKQQQAKDYQKFINQMKAWSVKQADAEKLLLKVQATNLAAQEEFIKQQLQKMQGLPLP